MKTEEPQHTQLDEQLIRDAATAAIHNLQLDIEVKTIVADGEDWCVQFSTEYRQFCDTFRDQFGKENSFELVREKIKRHILKHQQHKIRASVRIRRGKQERRAEPASLFETTVKAIGGLAGQTAELTGEIIKQASKLPETALNVIDETVKAAGTVIEPTSQPGQSVEQPLARIRVKTAARKTKRKSPSPARKATTKKASTGKKAASKKATIRKTISKKTISKKTTSRKKRAAAKSTAKPASRPSKKRSGTKKSAKRK